MSRPPLDPAERERVLNDALADVAKKRTGTLITYPVGEPYPRLRGMGFVHDGWRIYMSTRAVWQKAREIAANPNVTVLFVDTTRRPDHFIQIDGRAVQVFGDEFDAWQERRYQKEGDRLRAATAGMTRDDWAGWRIEPVRLRLMGYISHGPWGEAPVVVTRKALGLPPLDARAGDRSA